MRNVIIALLILFSCTSFTTYAQKKRTARFFAGGTTLNELNAGFYIADSQHSGKIDIEAGFLIPFAGEMKVYLNEFITNPFLQWNQTGPVLRMRYRNFFNKSSLAQFGISLDLYKLWSRDYLEDIGEHSGSHSNDYKVYSDEIVATGLTGYFYKSIDGTELNTWFFAIGMKYKWIDRTYSVEGTYDNQIPSDRTEQLSSIVPWFSLGLRFYL